MEDLGQSGLEQWMYDVLRTRSVITVGSSRYELIIRLPGNGKRKSKQPQTTVPVKPGGFIGYGQLNNGSFEAVQSLHWHKFGV